MRDYTVWTRIMGVVRSETMIWRIFATLWAGPTGVQRKALLCADAAWYRKNYRNPGIRPSGGLPKSKNASRTLALPGAGRDITHHLLYDTSHGLSRKRWKGFVALSSGLHSELLAECTCNFYDPPSGRPFSCRASTFAGSKCSPPVVRRRKPSVLLCHYSTPG